MRLGWWLTHPLRRVDAQQFFNGYFMTEPYPAWVEILLTDYDKWSSGTERQRCMQLLTLADEYPAIKISFMVGFIVGDQAIGLQEQALRQFCEDAAQHPCCLSVGVMAEYAGFLEGIPYGVSNFHGGSKAEWEATRDIINAAGLPMVNYRTGPSYKTPDLPISEGFYDVFHTNYPLCDKSDPSKCDQEHVLTWGDDPEYQIGISAGYWQDFPFPGNSGPDGLPRGWNQYSVDAVVSTAVDIHRATKTRHLVSVCQRNINGSPAWNNTEWRNMIWRSKDYRPNYILSTTDVPPPPPPQKGTLSVDTSPVKGEIFVDGQSVGIAPINIALDIGTYTITFGDITGYVAPGAEEVTIAADQTTVITGLYELTPIPPGQGILVVDTSPVKGEIFVDGVSIGMAPINIQVDTGIHSVDFGDVAGYVTPQSTTATVFSNQTTVITGTYVIPALLQGILVVDTVPIKGEVFVNGVSQGTAPINIALDAGVYQIIFGDVAGYITPPSEDASIYTDQTTVITGYYEPIEEEEEIRGPFGWRYPLLNWIIKQREEAK